MPRAMCFTTFSGNPLKLELRRRSYSDRGSSSKTTHLWPRKVKVSSIRTVLVCSTQRVHGKYLSRPRLEAGSVTVHGSNAIRYSRVKIVCNSREEHLPPS